MDASTVLEVLEEAGAPEAVIKVARRVIGLLEEGVITPEEAYYTIMGAVREHLVPLTPRQVSEIQRALGVRVPALG